MSNNDKECAFLKRDDLTTRSQDFFCKNYVGVCTAHGEDPDKSLRFDEEDIAIRCGDKVKFQQCERWRENQK